MTDKWCFSKAIHLNLFIGSSWSKKDELWQDGVVSFWVRNDASTVVLTVLRVKGCTVQKRNICSQNKANIFYYALNRIHWVYKRNNNN